MKVIAHGKVYEFTCKGCGCRYAAGANEVRDCGFYLSASCPECGTVNEYGGKEDAAVQAMREDHTDDETV